MPERFADSAVPAGGAMNAVIQAPNKGIQHSLDVDALHALGETGENDFTHVGFAVTVCILEIKNVRRGAYKNAAPVTEDRGGPSQVVSEDCAFVEDTVAVGVFEETNAPQVGRLVAALRIINHLDDEHAPVFIEGERDRAGDVRFARSQLSVETLLDLQCLESVPGFNRRKAGKVIGGDSGFGAIAQKPKSNQSREEERPCGKMHHIGKLSLFNSTRGIQAFLLLPGSGRRQPPALLGNFRNGFPPGAPANSPAMNSHEPDVIQNSKLKTQNSKLSRREFLGAAGILGLALATEGCKTTGAKDKEPIIDIHQHLGYSGRPDDVF